MNSRSRTYSVEVRAILPQDQYEVFHRAYSKVANQSKSQVMRDACMAWADDVLWHVGDFSKPAKPPKRRGRQRSVTSRFTAEQHERWLLAVARSQLRSSVVAANAAILRWAYQNGGVR